MKMPINFVGGLIGAIVLNLVHESARKTIKDAPRIHKIGEQAVRKISTSMNVTPPSGDGLFASVMAGDLMANAMYYSLIGKGDSQGIWMRGAVSGVTAGLGAIGLTKPLGLDDAPVNRSLATQVLTIAWYTIGGLVAAGAIKIMNQKFENS